MRCHSVLILACLLSVSCSNKSHSYRPRGFVQKGPFLAGTAVTVQELNGSLAQTGRSFAAVTQGDAGAFDVNASISSPLVDLLASGFFFDEISNTPSTAQINLQALGDMAGGGANVNVLTDLQHDRLVSLVQSGKSIAAAEAQSQTEVLAAFGISGVETGKFSGLSIAKDGVGNAILLAVTIETLEAAHLSASDPSTVAAEFSQFLAALRADITPDGVLTDPTLAARIRSASIALDLVAVRTNLTARYLSLGASAVIPQFEDWIDSDGDGALNGVDDSLDFPPVSTTHLGTVFTSSALPVLHVGASATAAISAGTLIVNGVDTGATSAPVHEGDSIAIRLMSGSRYDSISNGFDLSGPPIGTPLGGTTSTITVGSNTGAFTIFTVYPPPAKIGSIGVPMIPYGLVRRGNLLFANGAAFASMDRGLEILDVTSALNPSVVGSLSTSFSGSRPSRISKDGTRIYLGTTVHNVGQVDITNTSAPAYLSTITAEDLDFSADGRKFYTASYPGGNQVLDSASRTVLGSFDPMGDASAVVVDTARNLVFAASGFAGLWVLDVSTDTPSPVSHLSDSPATGIGSSYSIALSADRNTAYLGTTTGIDVVDVANAATPTIVGSYSSMFSNTSPAQIVVSNDGKYLFVAGFTFGLYVLDISIPADPRLVAVFADFSNAQGPAPRAVVVTDDERTAFVADPAHGLEIIGFDDSF